MKSLVLVLLSLLLVFPAFAQDAANPTACVETFDADTAYFPDTVEVEYADGFSIEYHGNYKVVTVNTPWQGASEPYIYVLVQCGTPVPEGYEGEQIIEVPATSAISMSTTYIASFVELGLVDRVVAVDEGDFIFNPEVLTRFNAGDIIEIGSGSTVNVEQTLALEPDVIFTFATGSVDYDTHPVLLEAGLNVVLNSDYLESQPLGRAEWVKFIAAFFNAEAEANAIFDEVESSYHELSEVAAEAESRPTVLANAMFGDTWYVSGGGSYAAQLIADAGGDYVWADDASTGSLPLSFEEVVDRALDANIWLNPNFWFTLADGLAEDERYAEFAAFENGQVYNNNARVTDFGGNDFGETGVLHPELILGDLIYIFHPDLLPDHELFFYQQLQ